LKEVLEVLVKLLELLFKYFNPTVVLVLIVAIPLVFFAYKIYTDWIKRKETNEVIKAKDETIQILNEQNRQLRVIQLKNQGWDDDAIEAVVMKEMPKNPIEAREMVKKSKRENKPKASN
jgi:predicted membrane protein